jgi:hypothetical protein
LFACLDLSFVHAGGIYGNSYQLGFNVETPASNEPSNYFSCFQSSLCLSIPFFLSLDARPMGIQYQKFVPFTKDGLSVNLWVKPISCFTTPVLVGGGAANPVNGAWFEYSNM